MALVGGAVDERGVREVQAGDLVRESAWIHATVGGVELFAPSTEVDAVTH